MPPDAVPLRFHCSGRSGPLPEETTIGIDLSYATSVFAVSDGAARDWKGVMTFGDAPRDSRGGLMLPLEGDRWMFDPGPTR